MMPDISFLKAACAMITAGTERGTGYLVDQHHVVTCEHVVRDGLLVSVLLERKTPGRIDGDQ